MAMQDPSPSDTRDGQSGMCRAAGPNGLRCSRSAGHGGNHAASKGIGVGLATWTPEESSYAQGWIDGAESKRET